MTKRSKELINNNNENEDANNEIIGNGSHVRLDGTEF